MKTADLLDRIKQLMADGETSMKSKGPGGVWLSPGEFRQFRSGSLSFLRDLYGEKHPHYTEFEKHMTAQDERAVQHGLGVLRAVQREIEQGWIRTARSLISADIFADFMEMAEYLLSEGYKDPAAVIIGSVLESHLRRLAMNRGIAVTETRNGKEVARKADQVNADLTKADAYNKLDQKSVTAWLDLRNKAAHGEYSAYQGAQVQLMYSGVLDFMSRVPD